MKENKNLKVPNSLRPSKVESIGLFLNRHSGHIALCAMAVMMMGSFVFASQGDPVEDAWEMIASKVQMWVGRLALVLIFVGGIQFGLGWYNEDPGSKARGIQTMIAGGIVGALAAITATFFA